MSVELEFNYGFQDYGTHMRQEQFRFGHFESNMDKTFEFFGVEFLESTKSIEFVENYF